PSEKMPVNTFDAWIAKQVKASKRETGSKTPEREEHNRLPESTYDAWMKKQKPKESSPTRPQSIGAPDTFDLWIDKRVAEWKDGQSGTEEAVVETGSTTGSE
ncbi:MAG: hypothetical protein OK457_10355, partial [Thaumarchaeota archaeon]|nr:hypothetical protein [Nitrososphaerota archaeon]